ncbi:cobyric acid synthase [Steroidobacter agaridevorans]|uniref:Cobyric acid synthase n=1 Tax=Steroidobacter agaridevorans TaxID=2695856 RepID=A0A829YFJ7_9GAMM|nr:cobyric acid synthase [Steroidobacter agaridevorans]GFE81356.1 cobyric acid synthase [Steroidobacter agaridevorans]
MAAIMIQGCGSDVGKSLLVAGLCRLFANRGLTVRPFKPQNMSNNAAVTPDGGEIGRSTALQALACRTPPTVDMNPVLLKPQSDLGSQLIVRGRRQGVMQASAHGRDKRELLQIAVESFRRLQQESELVIVEGAGSPAETNLRTHDIANMGFAHAADVPVVLVGDIDRGHVIASLVGAHAVLDEADRARIRGFIINKFRGDASLFDDGLRTIESRTGWPRLGVVPWLHQAGALPAEDAMQLDQSGIAPAVAARDRIRIVIPRLPHIANFDDFDPLRAEPQVELLFIHPGQPLPLDATLIVLPGSKATIADLEFVRSQGWDIDLLAHARRGGRVLGICAGYQMLGNVVLDPERIEGPQVSARGLGLLDIATTMTGNKQLRAITGTDLVTGSAVSGYEMHLGLSTGPATAHPFIRFDNGTTDGALSPDTRILGCHLHGLFHSPAFRSAFLARLGAESNEEDYACRVEQSLDAIAAQLEQALDIAKLAGIARLAI